MSNRVSLLILAELGLASGACAETPPNQNAEVAAPLVIPPMPSASASPPPRPPIPPPAPATTATAAADDDDDTLGGPPPPRPIPPGMACRTTKDCKGPRQVCSVPTGRKIGSCQTIQVIRGRPLVVAGRDHFADYTRPHEPGDDDIATLRQAAREEHASIAAFARTIAELMALGAPTWLLAETQRAMGDEIRHTERTLDLLEQRTGARPELGPLPAAVAPLARSTEEFFRDVLRGGAIGETLAAEDAERRRLATTDAELRAYYDMIVIDEARHAALAVKTLRWLTNRSTARA
jgi:hypothetical protein